MSRTNGLDLLRKGAGLGRTFERMPLQEVDTLQRSVIASRIRRLSDASG